MIDSGSVSSSTFGRARPDRDRLLLATLTAPVRKRLQREPVKESTSNRDMSTLASVAVVDPISGKMVSVFLTYGVASAGSC